MLQVLQLGSFLASAVDRLISWCPADLPRVPRDRSTGGVDDLRMRVLGIAERPIPITSSCRSGTCCRQCPGEADGRGRSGPQGTLEARAGMAW